MTLWQSLGRPRAAIMALAAQPDRVPLEVWSELVLIAIGGSLLYGVSLNFTLPGWSRTAGALWIALSAGLAWLIFAPVLIIFSRQPPFICAHACLVTMAYGEAVLTLAAIGNLLLRTLSSPLAGASYNFAMVMISNLVMATVLARQMGALGVPARTTLLCWWGALNGSGLLFFIIFARWLPGVV